MQPDPLVQAACAELVLRFFEALDASDVEACCACLGSDAAWHRQGEWLLGRDAIAAALRGRPAQRRTAHVVSNLRIAARDDGVPEAHFLLTAFSGEAVSGQPDPAPRLAGVRRCTDVFASTPEGWRIRRKTSQGVFGAAPAP
jgi:ketosteroid isomerase-like protein